MIQQYNAIHASLVEEISDIRDKITSAETNNSRANFMYADGSVVLPITDSNMTNIGGEDIFNNELTGYSNLLGSEYSAVDDNAILKIQKGNKALLATYAVMMVQKENIGKFYGMIIVDGTKKLNPLHPIIATMITAGEIQLSDSFTIIVYPYRNRRGLNTTIMEDYSRDIVAITSRVRSTQYLPTVSYRARRNIREDIRLMAENINDATISFSENGSRIEDVVIPVQLATISIVYPYYGLIHSRSDGSEGYYSKHLYPCLSGNIDTMSHHRGTTCVGELNSNSFSSLYVLSNMNINSMYFSEVITSASFNFIGACQSVSAQFLAAAAGIPFDKDEAPSDDTVDYNNEDEAPVQDAENNNQ